MNKENIKRWFVHVADEKYDGPLTDIEVQERLAQNLVRSDTYVWKEGMTEWKPSKEVSEIQELKKSIPQTPSAASSSAPFNASSESGPSGATLQIGDKNGIRLFPAKKLGLALGTSVGLFVVLIAGVIALSHVPSEGLHQSIRPLLLKISYRLPFTQPWIRLIPKIAALQDEDVQELTQALTVTAESSPKIAVALARQDLKRPYFFITSNLPKNTVIELYAVGKEGTLVNQLEARGKISFKLADGITRTEVMLNESGGNLPAGEYTIIAVESTDQTPEIKSEISRLVPYRDQVNVTGVPQNTQFVFAKDFFMGGARDSTYLGQLKSYHEKIAKSADQELAEVTEYASTLESVLKSEERHFSKVFGTKKLKSAAKSVALKHFETSKKLLEQIATSATEWTDASLKTDYFYGRLFKSTKSALDAVLAVIDLQTQYVQTLPDKRGFQIQIGKRNADADQALQSLKSKLSSIKNLPRSPTGLPARDPEGLL